MCLTDISLAQVAEPFVFTNSFVGTEEYLAPEVRRREPFCRMCTHPDISMLPGQVVNASGHSSAVDWWELGIFMYELLYGFTPFRGAYREQTFDNVLHKPLSFPEEPAVSKSCQSIIRKLLVRDPTKRLGAQGGAEEVKAQPFFAGLNFGLIRSTAAPLMPPVPSPPAKSVPPDDETIYLLD